ncbi:MAG: 1-acyl-sn-glycerol-3-phosphate acyltransferase [Bacteroidales bacterium]|jgi:1-acyl-sn-glycerol-3-phosphate acyltransferase|nr:1-acyl-sn-glycerol-3-phosphate acyltransferase [Bacteroidales bacterium]MBR6903256.1 1-acyl-sn-glycerol-3-phosphate acyltransferase [Bacteroidales bacterium]
MAKDYSAFGPAYRNFKVKEEVYVPEPPEEFSGDDPFVKMAPIRGELKDIKFDETYPYLDKSLTFRIWHFLIYLVTWLVAFPANWIRFGIKIEGREKIRRNRELFANGMMTVCNHVHRWDMICVLQAMRYRRAWIPMYAQPFRGKDGFLMKAIGGVAIPEELSGLRAFDKAMDELHANKQWIHLFPESCSWRFYAPLRPFKTGAFNMAYRHGLPVVPLVISFRPRTGWRKLFGKGEPLLTIHVGDPIVPDLTVPRKAEVARIRDLAHQTMLDMAGIVSNPWPSSID